MHIFIKKTDLTYFQLAPVPDDIENYYSLDFPEHLDVNEYIFFLDRDGNIAFKEDNFRYIEIANIEKQERMYEVINKTRIWLGQLQLNIIKESDKKRLEQWLEYAQRLDEVDLSKAPTVNWPQKPE
ncbi:tail fiber assembly protein [Proteus mirabilis]|uniref:tail fiber assembly protein n=1 Tax=Proteus mirabilis TaxID=584 RepID=UPI001B9E41AB|nr:tail fiber assembly protein [Proteus mirabilis]EKW1742728.1 tail fiber assembly protein [Proteus mirabilis]EMA4723244.1 tail fiber assembly protein [Proteus mirabilis]MDM3725314.1 tail fiber assembly protein [Proteus mirabilis]HBC7486636.1 tail fiber assembly protein [Proteus mirabilis]